jgi:hypothetical protein
MNIAEKNSISFPSSTLYFGVIGNRDYIKRYGEKRPFWEYLDEQPDGWLTSLTYRRKDLPVGKSMIYDCGAWSYKNAEIPPVNSGQVAALYAEHAPQGSMVIAPDHMLIEGSDVEYRKTWNAEQAKLFLGDCPPSMKPMACVHGMNLDERVEHAKWLESIGYKYIAIGGLAARASQKALVISWVKAIRESMPNVWLHVLGLSSPDYMRTWREIGIESADGSSHFKQAFTGGAFFTQEGAKLSKHQAARPGNVDDLGIVAPQCHCKACATLIEEGIDTRSYGSNENNMGRAAHNLNMLMRAQKVAMRKTLVLVACCGPKLKGMHEAGNIYQSDLFQKSKEWAEREGDAWAILSAKHGVLSPTEVIQEYDVTLNEMPAAKRREWCDMVREQLASWKPERIVVLAGNRYCEWITDEWMTERPMEGLGIGRQLAWLKKENQTEELLLL